GGGGGASEPIEPDSAESAERHTPKDRKSLTPAKKTLTTFSIYWSF
ncbi:hypothetical protein GBAR_LOCUS23003, partial [Geodia barretti]